MNQQHKRIWAKGLLINCPMGNSIEDCPAAELRKISLKERIRTVNEMEDTEVDSIIEHHEECIRNREEDFFKQAKKVNS